MNDQTEMFSLPLSRAARDEALERVLANAGGTFKDRALLVISCMRGVVTGEDIRITCTNYGVVPHHHNAWGALTVEAKRKNLLKDNHKLRAMRSVRSHARKTMTYIINGPAAEAYFREHQSQRML